MKTLKKTSSTALKLRRTGLFYTLLLLSAAFNTHKTYTMEPEDVKKVGWVALAGGVIIGGYAAYQQFLSYIHAEQEQPIEPFRFTELPQDVQAVITSLLFAGVTATSLKEAAQAINALAQVNKELNTLINDPNFCLKTIKTLSQKFNCSNETAAEILQTKEAKNRLAIQKRFIQIIQSESNNPIRNNLKYVCQDGFDLEFTYNNPTQSKYFAEKFLTPLMIASVNPQTSVINLLLKQGSNINQTTDKGKTALMLAAEYSVVNSHMSAIKALLASPKLNINQQDEIGNTALIYAIENSSNNNYNFKNVEFLIEASADPELANHKKLTPLQAAQAGGYQRIIDFIQEAIEKKHEKQGK